MSHKPQIAVPLEELLAAVDSKSYVADKVDWEVLKFLGMFVLKNVLPAAKIQHYADCYFADLRQAKLQRTQFHRTEVKLPEDHLLRQIVHETELVEAVRPFFGGNVGASYIRVVKKDQEDTQPVFLHQDTGYQVGGYERYSLFIPLTPCNYENGGLELYPGTHHFGYLGDVGEIIDPLPPEYPRLKTSVVPGDILVMHSAVWHQSPPNVTLNDRVYIEINIQHLDEPTASIPMCGTRRAQWELNVTPDEILRNSRAQRIRQMYQEIEAFQAKTTRPAKP